MIPPVLIGLLQGMGVDMTASPVATLSSVDIPQYEVVQTISAHRFDGASQYYVLMDSVDLTTDDFKADVKRIISDMATKNGVKISIEVHDSQESLDLSYKQYGDLSLKRTLTDAETSMEAEHFISAFDGQMSTGTYTNTLSFFPGTFTTNDTVGKYIETIEFSPLKVVESVTSANSGPNGEYATPSICDINSYVARAVIAGYTKYPDEADDSCRYATLTSLGDHLYEVSGYVIAKNAFGVEGRLYYKIKMLYKGGRANDLSNWENIGEPEITEQK